MRALLLGSAAVLAFAALVPPALAEPDGAKAAAYVDAYMEIIRWDNAAKLFERYSREA